MLEARDGIDPMQRLKLAEAIHAHLDEAPTFNDADGVGLYWAIGSEVLTTGLAQRLAEQEQRRIFLPFLLNGELQMTEWRPADPVVDAEYGGMHPRYRRAVPLDELDVLVVPGVAFDEHGHRLGYGTGHFDRLLARLDTRTTRIGLCFGAQVVAEVPTGPSDQSVQFLVTEDGVTACASVSDGSIPG